MTGENQKIRTTLIVDKNIIKQIKRVALEKETTQTEIINDYLQKGLNNENILKVHKVMVGSNSHGRNLGKTKNKHEIKDMIGMISKDANAMELKRKGQGRGV